MTRHCRPESASIQTTFVAKVWARIAATRGLLPLLEKLIRAARGEIYLFGGTLRRAMMDCAPGYDFDLMVPNGDNRVFNRLADLKIPYLLNRRRHHRYRWRKFQLDVNQPYEWHPSFGSIVDALSFFDLRIDSLALHLGSRTVLDPFGLLTRARPSTPGINWERWSTMPPLELAILSIRLHRILVQCPSLALSLQDVSRLQRLIANSLVSVDWDGIRDRTPLGKSAFLQEFERLVLLRSNALEQSPQPQK
jgi:hypothetical protein